MSNESYAVHAYPGRNSPSLLRNTLVIISVYLDRYAGHLPLRRSFRGFIEDVLCRHYTLTSEAETSGSARPIPDALTFATSAAAHQECDDHSESDNRNICRNTFMADRNAGRASCRAAAVSQKHSCETGINGKDAKMRATVRFSLGDRTRRLGDVVLDPYVFPFGDAGLRQSPSRDLHTCAVTRVDLSSNKKFALSAAFVCRQNFIFALKPLLAKGRSYRCIHDGYAPSALGRGLYSRGQKNREEFHDQVHTTHSRSRGYACSRHHAGTCRKPNGWWRGNVC